VCARERERKSAQHDTKHKTHEKHTENVKQARKKNKQRQTNLGPVDALGGVLLLLEREEVARELLLQALVRVVDAQLLEAVGRELLKAVDVEDRDRRAFFCLFFFVLCVCVVGSF
jgi:hypothetical protein